MAITITQEKQDYATVKNNIVSFLNQCDRELNLGEISNDEIANRLLKTTQKYNPAIYRQLMG